MASPQSGEQSPTSQGAAQPGGAAGFQESAAMVRAEFENLDATLNALVTRLSSVPGIDVSVSPRPGMLRKLIGDVPYVGELGTRSAHVHEVAVTVGSNRYWLHASDGSVRCGRSGAPVDGGPREEELTFTDWADALFDDIGQRNLVNHDAMAALRRLVEHDRA